MTLLIELEDTPSDNGRRNDSQSDDGKSDDSFAHRDGKYWASNGPDDSRKLFNHEASADVTVQYGSHKIYVHRTILSLHSTRLRRLFRRNATSNEGKKDILQLIDEGPEALDDMLHRLYGYDHFPTFDIEFIGDVGGSHNDWERHLKAAIIAEKYGVPSMEVHAIEICRVFCTIFPEWRDAVGFAKCALQYGDQRKNLDLIIQPLCEDGRFIKLLQDESFRALLARYFDTRAILIDEHFSDLIKTGWFCECLKTDSELAVTIVDRLMEDLGVRDGENQPSKKRKKSESLW